MATIKKIVILVIALVCLLVQITPVIRSGLSYSYGKGFWGPTGHDGIWHLSLINNIDNPFSIAMPIFSGEKLKNYHPFFDIILAYLSKVTNINSDILLFQLFPIVSTAIFLHLSYSLGKKLTKSDYGGLCLMVFHSTSNSLGWIVKYFTQKNLGGESLFWAMQSPSNQINPPYALSLILILILLNILISTRNGQLSKLHKIITFFIILFTPITKAYAAIPVFIFFGLFTLKSRLKSNYVLLIIGLLGSITIYSIYNKVSGGILVFEPFWFLRSLIDSPDKFYLPQLSSLRFNLESKTYFDPRLILIYGFTFIVFIVGNFAWRLIGMFRANYQKNWFHQSMLFVIVVLTLIPTIFIQKGTSWNTIQFLYYAQFIADILLAVYVTKKNKYLLVTIICLSNTIAIIGMLPNYLGTYPPTAISVSELTALDYLKKLPNGVVLTVPYDNYLKTNFTKTPIPIYAYETTGYVSAYSHHPTYLEDEMNLTNSGYDVKDRRNQSLKFFQQTNIFENRGFLLNNQISYIYLAGIQKEIYKLSDPGLYIKKVFENPEVTIFQVLK